MASKETLPQSLQLIKVENKVPPASPKKMNKTVRCAILTKSPLKPCRTGQMFTMTLCDEDPLNTLKGVCFNEKMFDQLEVKKTYDVNNWKLKRAYYGKDDLEMQIDDESDIQESKEQFQMEHSSFNLSQVVRGEAQNIRLISVKAKVLAVGEVEQVGKYPNTKLKREVIIADETGQINVLFWQEMVKSIEFQENDVIMLENVYVSKFSHIFHLTYNSQSFVTKLDENLEVGCTVAQSNEKPLVVASIKDYITAFKDFRCVIKCINCNAETELTERTQQVKANGGYVVKCSTCTTTFLGKDTNAVNDCKFRVRNEWCVAKKEVRIIFKLSSSPWKDVLFK